LGNNLIRLESKKREGLSYPLKYGKTACSYAINNKKYYGLQPIARKRKENGTNKKV
jgi:hypothetical protein